MKSLLLLSLGLLPCSAAIPAQVTTPQVQEAYSTQDALKDATEAYHILSHVNPLCFRIRYPRLRDDDELPVPEQIRQITQKVRPYCARLRQLPPEQLKQVCMLADAILWHSDWLVRKYCSEELPDIQFEWLDWGFEELENCASLIRQRLDSSTATAEEKAAWRELLQEFGGEASLEIPRRLHNERRTRDCNTVLTFFRDFCAAAAEMDEAACLSKLEEQAKVLASFHQSGEMELLWVNAMVAAFEDGLGYMRDECPFPRPILPKKRRTPARMQALEPFFSAIPALKPLLFDTK